MLAALDSPTCVVDASHYSSCAVNEHGVVGVGLAGELTEQLRLLLEPTQASRLAGDFRTGKRISMRKVVAYVASHFRKDKIWLRRTRPDKRQYQVSLTRFLAEARRLTHLHPQLAKQEVRLPACPGCGFFQTHDDYSVPLLYTSPNPFYHPHAGLLS